MYGPFKKEDICKHYDSEMGMCEKRTCFKSPIPNIATCTLAPCDDFEAKVDNCRWCNSYRIDPDLNPDNDFHAGCIGTTTDKNQIMMCSGYNEAPRIEFNRWNPSDQRWHTVGIYYPKFCPECGREISEWPKRHKEESYES